MARAKRKLELLCLKHSNVVTVTDGGNERDGGDSSERAQARATMRKMHTFPDGRSVPMFALARPPERLFPGDRFDAEVLCDRGTGDFTEPSREWLALRDAFLRVAIDRRAGAEAKANDLLQKKVAEGLTNLIAGQVKANEAKGPASKAKKNAGEEAQES